MATTNWLIPGSDDQPIYGDVHMPAGIPRGVVIIAHGFKGYKDYGMFPRIATWMRDQGFVAHRFNFSHSGMTNTIETFERPDLFERDTWNKQVVDCRAVIHAVQHGDLAGGGLPYVLFGHSRGGVSVLLTAGRFAGDSELAQPVGVATAAAPSSTCSIPDEAKELIRSAGFVESPSSRTGQNLRINLEWLEEQEQEPESHDLLALVAQITCPILLVHGADDPTVPAECATEIAQCASDARTVVIAGANHVFNAPNPFPADGDPPPELHQLLNELTSFSHDLCPEP